MEDIFWKIRLPRVLLAALTGAVLSLIGLVFQALLRNPLAEPYILGVSGGAAIGAILGILSHDVNWASMYGSSLLLLAGGEVLAAGKPEYVIDADLLERAYGCRLLVDRSPATGARRVTPLPRECQTR